MSRLLALVGAIAMIAAAIVLRGALDDDGGDGGGDGRGRDPDGQVVCATELRDVCPGGGVIEDVDVTADRLVAADAVPPSAWLTFDPWPSMVDEARNRSGLEPLFPDRAGLASSPLVAVGPAELDGCDWSCLAGDGELRVGTRRLDGGLGLLHLAVIAGGLVGTVDFATNDLVPEVRSRLSAAADAAERSTDPVRQLLQSRAFFDVALSIEAEAAAALDAADPSRKAGLALLYPAPVANAVVVAAGDADLLGGVADRLVDAGWSADGGSPSGLPSAGVLTALRGLL